MDAVLSQILPGGPRGFFVAGVTKAKAYVARLDDSGRIVWERHGGDAADVFMAVSQDRVILAANTVPTIDALRADGEIRIDAYDADGTQKATARVAGRRGRISGSEGGVAIVYDKGVSENLDIWLTEFDTELRSLRSSHVVKSEHGYAGFRIAASDDGGYVIAGAKERRPFAQRVESTGRVAWSFWSETLPIGLDVDVVASAQGVFMLYPRLEEGRTTVRVVALKE